MSKAICICSTPRDHRELAALANMHTFLHHDYASALEDLSVDECPSNMSISDPEQEIETILRCCRAEHIQGVITTDDYARSFAGIFMALNCAMRDETNGAAKTHTRFWRLLCGEGKSCVRSYAI
jgi:hypothetical protein